MASQDPPGLTVLPALSPTPDTGGIRQVPPPAHGSFSRISIHMLSINSYPFKGVIEKREKMSELIELEDQEELIQNEQEIETAAYKEAFDHFDWNHSGRIPTSVKPVPMQ